jgi:tryptophan synthase alpha chain
MNRIDHCFASCQQQNKKVLISFITAGDPTPQTTVPALHALVAGGADILELGIPFSDPGADGKAIQAANERALVHQVGIRDVLAMVAEFRTQDSDTPVVLMGYLNPIENMGYEIFAQEAAKAGVDGVIVVDLPPEESDAAITVFDQYGIYPIFLVAPTSTEARIRNICAVSKGFIYYVSVKGVTGDKIPDFASLDLDSVRRHSDLPIAIGFGIRDRVSVNAAVQHADAAVVGSAIVALFEQNQNSPERIPELITRFVTELTTA